MQSKVSMVVPCYNKEKYIGEMLDSIIAQEWDNIELILVNDGSTDCTLEIILEYEPKFRTRGFEVIIVNQENAGVCASVKTGLERITGKYVCAVDSDDELDHKYVSTMAEWLEEHEEYDFVACEGAEYTGRGENKEFRPIRDKRIVSDDPYVLERYIFAAFRPMVWIYMVRTDYFHKCRIAATYYTDTKGTHEPGFCIPLFAYGGKYYFFPLQLYRFNINGEGHSRFECFEKAQHFFEEYYKLTIKAIEAIPETVINNERRKKLNETALFAKYIRLYRRTYKTIDGQKYTDMLLDELTEHINDYWGMTPPVTKDVITGSISVIANEIINLLTDNDHETFSSPTGRVIGYGTLGKAAGKLLPLLRGSVLEPTILWDANGDGITVKKPDPGSLCEDDLILVFPKGDIESMLRESFGNMSFRTMYNEDLCK